MSTKMQKRLPLVIVLVLAIMLASLVSVTLVNSVAVAEGDPTPIATLTIGQFSDIHYFPLAYCYQQVKADDYEQSEFFKSMTGDTKLVIESGMILKQQIQGFINDAKAGKAPHYLFASGDLSKNGEVKALVDVANSLRYLQNEVRKCNGYESFQIFATVGNHDLYNTSGALYSQVDGTARQSDALTTAQFALVFSGLGYPDANLDGEDGKINLTEYMPEDYWSDVFTGGYQTSYNATNLDIHYYNEHLEKVNTDNTLSNSQKLNEYYQIGDGNNNLSFTVDLKNAGYESYSIMVIDASDREQNEVGAYVRINKAEYEVIKKNTQADGNAYKYYLSLGNDTIDTENPLLAGDNALESALDNGDIVYRSTGLDHLCGGRLTEGVIDWMEKFCDAQNATTPTLGEETIITCFHQNALPHWEMEDEILKDFTIYNWEYTAKRLLDMGTRYVFTGHMHVCDAMTYTDAEGRTLYDFQTGSCVSYYSPRRYTTVNRYEVNGKLAEDCESQIFSLDDDNEKPFQRVPSSNVFSCADWNQEAYEAAKKIYDENPTAENWQQLVASNPDYLAYIITYDDSSTLSYNDYISKDVYSRLVERMVSHFIDEETILGMLDGIYDMLQGDNMLIGVVRGAVFPELYYGDEGYKRGQHVDSKHAIVAFVEYLIDEVLHNGGYVVDGKEYDNALDLVNDIIGNIINWEYGDATLQSPTNASNAGKLTFKDLAAFIMTAHTMGNEISLSESYDYIDDVFDETPTVGENESYRYQHPYDRTYRKRMVAAMNDLHQQLISGKFVEDLLTALLDPIFTEEGSLLKTLLNRHFDFKDAIGDEYLSEVEFYSLKKGLSSITSLLDNTLIKAALSGLGMEISLPEGFTINAEDFCLGELIDSLFPVIKPLVGQLLGFSMEGDGLVEFVESFLDSYLVDSFYKGLGGIADDIAMTFGTDVYPDLADPSDGRVTSYYTPQGVQATHGYSYVSSTLAPSSVGASFNAATQDNGRVPSRVTANFSTANSQTEYTIKFYTDEYVYGTFRLLDENGNVIGEVSTSRAAALNAYKSNAADMPYLDTSASKSFSNGVSATISTQTKPQYIPLIDLGLLCLTHSEISYEVDKEEIDYIYGQRDDAEANSVIYWNVHTITVSGLEAGKTYYYDIAGNYELADSTQYFSLVDFISLDGYDKNYLSLTTAPDSSVDAFEFLTIADIQGMIQSMYDKSHEAVDALLKDERVNSFDFILNAGDMCDNGKNFAQWGMALNTYQDLNLNTSTFFTSGNHENGSGAMGRYFAYTSLDENGNAAQISGEYYSFDYANAHFIVLDTNDASADGLGAEQLAWLENDLANSNAKWKFVLMHKSLYSGGSHALDSEVVTMRSQLGELFAQNGVNIVFGGHDHTYTTTYLVDKDGNITDKSHESVRYTGDGVLYITLGTMGTKYYTYKENETTTDSFDVDNSILHTLDSQTFGKVVVDGDSIYYSGYYYNRTTGTIEEISAIELSANKPETDKDNKLLIILLSTIIPGIVVIGAGVGVGVYFGLKKKNAKAAQANTEDDGARQM